MRMSNAALLIASMACPSATPERRLNDRVTDGNWPWCVTDRGPTFAESTVTSDESRTAAPVSGDFR